MGGFPKFLARYGPVAGGRAAESKGLERRAAAMPAELAEFLAGGGVGSYGGGLLFVLDPSEHDELLREWLDDASGASAFLRDAFGAIYFWKDGAAWYLNPHTAKVTKVLSDITKFFEGFTLDAKIVKSVFKKPVFAKAVKRVGVPGPDDCLVPEPALALGGAFEAELIARRPWRAALDLLRQLAD